MQLFFSIAVGITSKSFSLCLHNDEFIRAQYNKQSLKVNIVGKSISLFYFNKSAAGNI